MQHVAIKFALREDNGKLNLRPVVGYDTWVEESGDKDASYTHQYFGNNQKVYAGDADNEGILSSTYMYNRTENDLFAVTPSERPMYRRVINPLDTVSIYRNDNSKLLLFEDGIFLGMENIAQFTDMAPAMVADTAYAPAETYRPQYMLVVDPEIQPAGRICPIHGNNPTCPDAHKVDSKGWVSGRYLVNLVDTAIVWDKANKHKDDNPYVNSEKYYRLGFVDAKHYNDSLIVASTNDSLFVGGEDFNQAKFAFRYIDNEAGSFVIETADFNKLGTAKAGEMKENYGYLKRMNGLIVVVSDIKDADIYNMNEEEAGNPTANEGVNAATFSVVATDGAVIVKGAEGKNVVITNVLGQQIANTVVTSSEATIAAPAGIVVVAVEGEAAVKAIVK